jgi:hypothetical protein
MGTDLFVKGLRNKEKGLRTEIPKTAEGLRFEDLVDVHKIIRFPRKGADLGDVVYYFTKRKEDQSLTESAEKVRVGLSNRERADWIKGASL